MIVQPYLSFEGRCEEALEFYKQVLGAEVQMLMRMQDAPEQPPPGTTPPDNGNKVLHSSMKIGDSVVMATDGYCAGKSNFEGITLSLTVDSDAEAEKYFAALADGGETKMPLSPTFFASKFGMVVDRFGVSWMVHKPNQG